MEPVIESELIPYENRALSLNYRDLLLSIDIGCQKNEGQPFIRKIFNARFKKKRKRTIGGRSVAIEMEMPIAPIRCRSTRR